MSDSLVKGIHSLSSDENMLKPRLSGLVLAKPFGVINTQTLCLLFRLVVAFIRQT